MQTKSMNWCSGSAPDASDGGVRTAECRRRLDGVEARIAELEREVDDGRLKDVRKKIALLRRAYDFCDTNVFVLTSVGMLKAGKSTLVSLLAGNRNASPTGFGVDTTLRPALILAADEARADGGIDIWNEGDLADQEENPSRQDLFERVLLFERNGQKHPADSRPLTPDGLKKALCEKFVPDPVLVVVRVPRDEASVLVKSKLAILDTPGLDSSLSEWTKVTRGTEEKGGAGDGIAQQYAWIIDATDVAVFLQSSVSALNSEARRVLARMKEEKKETLLVHNEMRAKFWRSSASVKPEEDAQKKTAISVFADAGFPEGKIVPMTVNLGKAYDAMPGFVKDSDLEMGISREELKRESGITTFENTLNAFLEQNGDCIRREHCIGLVGKRVQHLIDATMKAVDALKSDVVKIAEDMRQLKAEYKDIVEWYQKNFRPGRRAVKVDLLVMVECLLKGEFSSPDEDYDESDIVKALERIRGKLPILMKEEILGNVDRKVHVKFGDGNVSLTDCVQDVFDVFEKLVPEDWAEDKRWRDRLDEAKSSLLKQEDRNVLVRDCVKASIPDDTCSTPINISSAVKLAREQGGGHRNWKRLLVGVYYTNGEAVSISCGCRKDFEAWEDAWRRNLAARISNWLDETLRQKLSREFENALRRIVDEEVRQLEARQDAATRRIAELSNLTREMENLNMRRA